MILRNATNPPKMGEYFAYAGDFGRGDLIPGQDFNQSIEIGPHCPDGTVIRTSWPFTPNRKEIRGYVSIRHGEQSRGRPEKPLTPVRVADLAKLEIDFRLRVEHVGRVNVLDDTFFYPDPGDTRVSSQNFELCIYHWPDETAVAWAQRPEEKQLGIFTDRFGRVWWTTFLNRSDGKRIVRFFPLEGPALRGTLDKAAMIRFCVEREALSPALFYTGTAIGVEPITGSCEMTLERWAPR